jgi:hypothetical protein
METCAVGLPLPSRAVTKRTPPVARALNSLAAVERKSKSLPSAQTKAPSCAGPPFGPVIARRPAAKL